MQRTATLTSLFAGLTILISCLGLFGLAAYMAENRIREIGIRKVLGASIAGIVRLLSAESLKIIIVSITVAFPLAYWAVSGWMSSFAYKSPIGVWIFIVAGLLMLIVASVTISFQAVKAAIANPVKSLRTE